MESFNLRKIKVSFNCCKEGPVSVSLSGVQVVPMVRRASVTRQECVTGEQPVSQAQKPCETHTGSGGHCGVVPIMILGREVLHRGA